MNKSPQYNQQVEPEKYKYRKCICENLETGHLYLNNAGAMQ